MKKIRKVLGAALIAAFVVAISLFAACVAKTYKLTFKDGETVIDEITAKEGVEITTPDTEKDGYRFEGWYDNAELQGNTVEIPSEMPAANKTYYAKYTKVYTVKFMYGEEVIKTVTDVQGTAVADYEIDPADLDLSSEYDFLGWYSDADLTDKVEQIVTAIPDGNITYYAKILQKAAVRYFDVSEESEDGYGEEPVETENKHVGDVITVAGDDKLTSIEEGILFLGWSTAKDGKTSLKAGEQYTLTGSVTLYAQLAFAFTSVDDKYTGTLYVSANGDVLYIDGDNTYEGTAERSPLGDLEFTVNLGDGEKTGMLTEDGFVLRDNDLVGYYTRYNWISKKTGEEDLYLGGYLYQGGSGDDAYVFCLGVIATDNGEYIGIVVLDGECSFSGNKITENGYDEDDEYVTSFKLGDYDGEEFVVGDGNYFREAGEESRYLNIQDEQLGLWVVCLMDGSIGWPATGKLFDMALFLDGYGYAEIVVLESGEFVTYASGTYAAGENYEDCLGEWVFTPDEEFASAIDGFTFKLLEVPASGGGSYLCWWEVLTYTDGNAKITFKDGTNAIYTDADGNVKNGVFTKLDDEGEIVLFTETFSGQSTCFMLDKETNEFEVAVADNDFIIKDGVVLTYLGTNNGTADNPLKFPDSAAAIADYAFLGSGIAYIDLNNVETVGFAAFFNCASLAYVKFGENIAEIGSTSFAFNSDYGAPVALTLVFSGDEAPDLIYDARYLEAFYGRANLTIELSSVDALRSFWAEDSWEKYIGLLHFAQSVDDEYYGLYVNSSFAAIEVGETTTVNGVAGLFTVENGNVSILAYDKSQANNCWETTGTLADNVLTLGGVKYYKLAADTQLTFTNEEDGSTLAFTFPGTVEFTATATYTPAGGSAEQVPLFVEYGENGIEVMLVRNQRYGFNVTLNYNPEAQNTFTAEYTPIEILFESYDYLVGDQDEYDYFNAYFPYYGATYYAIDGYFESIEDADGNTLEFSDAEFSYLGSQASGNNTFDFYAITFTHSDGYYYYIRVQTIDLGIKVFFVNYWYRAEVKTFTQDNLTLDVYCYVGGDDIGISVGDFVTFKLYADGEPVPFDDAGYNSDYTVFTGVVYEGEYAGTYTITFIYSNGVFVSATIAYEAPKEEEGDE